MSHAFEIEIIHYIQEFRNPTFDGFFKFLDFFDRHEFFFVLIPAIWLAKGWKWGLKLFYILFLSSLVNHQLKDFFVSPRPFHIDPSTTIIQVNGYGFPSGAAQTVILLSGLLLYFWKSHWKWPIIFSYSLLVSFSRLYLGVHFLTDIVAGWIAGFILLLIFLYLFPKIEKKLENFKPTSLFLLSLVVPLTLLFWQYSPFMLPLYACAIGMGIGIFINHQLGWNLTPSREKKDVFIRLFIGVLGTFACYYLITLLPLPKTPFFMFLKYLVTSLWITTGSHYIIKLKDNLDHVGHKKLMK